MSRRILVVAFFTDWTTHLGTELEICQRSLDAGDELHILVCDGSIGGCRVNPDGDRSRCQMCLYRRLRSHQLLKGNPIEHFLSDYIKGYEDYPVESFSNIRDANAAKEFVHKGHSLGWGALSSAIDVYRDPEGKDERFAGVLPRLSRAAVLSYEGTLRFLTSQPRFDEAFIFNGRFECTLGARFAIEEHGGCSVVFHERGANIQRFTTFRDDILHSRNAATPRIRKHWEDTSDLTVAKREAELFFLNRRTGKGQDWWSFIAMQRSGTLPENWDPSRPNIAIFNSSEDEWASIGDEWKSSLYTRQSIGIIRIVSDLLERAPRTHIYLRMHPNLKDVHNSDIDRLHAIQSPNFTLIEPESPVSSYTLMEKADVILSFGSTMGIEAAYWGKTSVLAGPAEYENLGSVYVMKNHSEVLDTLLSIPPPLDRLGALQFGYYRQTVGEKFVYWQADGFIDGKFSGKSLHFRGTRFAQHVIRWSKRFSSRGLPVRLLCRIGDTLSNTYSFLGTIHKALKTNLRRIAKK